MLEILYYPFIQRAFLAGIFLAFLLSFFGIFVVLRKMSFFSDGIAHASLAGVAIGVVSSLNPVGTAIITAIVFSFLIYILEHKYKISSDSAIGVLFAFGMSLGVIIMSFLDNYQTDLMSFLFGNILAISFQDLIYIYVIGSLVLFFLFFFKNKLIILSLDRDSAYLLGVRINIIDPLFYIFLAISVVLGIKVLGIVLVSALLIIPVVSAKLLSSSFKQIMFFSVLIGELNLILGILISFFFDLPTGPSIVLFSSLVFVLLILVFKKSKIKIS